MEAKDQIYRLGSNKALIRFLCCCVLKGTLFITTRPTRTTHKYILYKLTVPACSVSMLLFQSLKNNFNKCVCQKLDGSCSGNYSCSQLF